MNVYSLKDALQRSLEPGGSSFSLAQLGETELEFYAPQKIDPQTPHSRDEFYIIARGSGTFQVENRSLPFAPGDVLFVEAGIEHRFSNFSDDFATWVLFIGVSR